MLTSCWRQTTSAHWRLPLARTLLSMTPCYSRHWPECGSLSRRRCTDGSPQRTAHFGAKLLPLALLPRPPLPPSLLLCPFSRLALIYLTSTCNRSTPTRRPHCAFSPLFSQRANDGRVSRVSFLCRSSSLSLARSYFSLSLLGRVEPAARHAKRTALHAPLSSTKN